MEGARGGHSRGLPSFLTSFQKQLQPFARFLVDEEDALAGVDLLDPVASDHFSHAHQKELTLEAESREHSTVDVRLELGSSDNEPRESWPRRRGLVRARGRSQRKLRGSR